MLCQNCKKNEADKTFVVHWMGMQHQMHLCSECLEQMWQYAGAVGKKEAFKAMAGWWPGKEEPRQLGDVVFTKETGAVMTQRRKLAALRVRLEEAAIQENFEEAARLRDRIAAMEKEAYSHECE